MNRKIIVLSLLLLAASAALVIADDEKAASQAASITMDEVKDHLYYIASDELEGRGTGSPGFKIAQQYAVTNFRQAGLKPIVVDADGKKTWYQTVPLIRATPGQGNVLFVNGTKIIFGKDYIINNVRAIGSCTLESEVVFGGYGISEFEMGYDDLADVDVDGKIVAILVGGPMKDGKSILPENVAALYSGLRAVTRKIEKLERAGAKAVIILADERTKKYWDRIAPRATGESVRRAADVVEKQIPAVMVTGSVRKMLLGEDKSTQARELKAKAKLVVEVKSEEFECRNVVAYLPGTDESLKDQYVTVGAHYDHLGMRNGVVYNGANDNGSGSVAVIEIAEAVALAPARRPMIFILYTGEELGLLGARHFVDNPPVTLEKIVTNINYEMIARGSKTEKGETIVNNITDDHFPEINDFAKAVQARTKGIVFKGISYFGGSDHHAFYSKGIPIMCFTVGKVAGGGPSDYHQPEDDAEKVNFECMTEAIKFTYEVIMEFANSDNIPTKK